MNQYNQVTLPQLAMVNAIMAAMQTQPQQLQAAGGVPNAISTSGPTMVPQQPPAFPNFVLQPHQPQIPGPSSVPQLGGQPWVLPALPTNAPLPIGAQSNATAKQPTVDEIVAGVVAAMKANAPQEEAPDKSLARFAPDDERVLVNELRKAKREGLTPLQGISKLDQVNNHTAAAWKDYFIKHVERLSPKVYPQAYANTVPLKSTAGGSRSGGQSTSSSQPRHPVTNGDLSDSEQSNSDEEAAVGGSAASRSKRGAPVVEYHDEVRIPHLASGVKPKPPQRDLQHNNRRFTKEDKVFFIHYLKYRLRKGPVPSKEQLYGELTEQAPHHNADSWKRHWDKACTLPNQIYIQALKRVNNRRREPRRPAPRAKQDPAESSEAEDEEEDEEEEGDATPAEPSDDPVSEPTASRKRAPTAKKAQGGPVPHRCKVSDEDIRAMAQYIVEKRKCDGWEALKGPDRWEEFASRPENIKRRLNAWIGITYSRARDIQAYIQEYESEQSSTPAAEDKPRASPTVDRASDLRQGDPKAGQAKDAMRSATKRALEGEESKIEGSRSPTQKRPKLVKPEAIVISD